MKTAAAVLALALIGGFVGGLFAGESWFSHGYLALVLAVAALLLCGIWQRRASIMEILMDDPDEPPATPSVTSMEQELRRKDRGEIRTNR